MSFALPLSVGAAYAFGLVGFHRWNVYRTRRNARFYPTLEWIDWDTVLSGVLSTPDGMGQPALTPYSGGPSPRALATSSATHRKKHDVLSALVSGNAVHESLWETSGFSGGEARWLQLVGESRHAPELALERMERTPVADVADAYWRTLLSIRLRPSPLNVEWFVFSNTRQVNRWLQRFGDHPGLYFIRAKLASLLGRNAAVLNDLARAVYFSREAPFYLHVVTQSGFVDDVRPALAKACRAALERQGDRELSSASNSE